MKITFTLNVHDGDLWAAIIKEFPHLTATQVPAAGAHGPGIMSRGAPASMNPMAGVDAEDGTEISDEKLFQLTQRIIDTKGLDHVKKLLANCGCERASLLTPEKRVTYMEMAHEALGE